MQQPEAGARTRCRACQSEIDARARRCPRCARWQSRLSTESVVLIGSLAFWLMTCVPFWFMTDRLVRMLSREPASPGDVAGLRVVESAMFAARWGGAERLAVVGRIANQSKVRLTEVQIEAQFRDADGTLMDTETQYVNGHDGCYISPGQDQAFRMNVHPDFPLASYSSCKVVVRSASRKGFFESF